jgi:hypothetical protein
MTDDIEIVFLLLHFLRCRNNKDEVVTDAISYLQSICGETALACDLVRVRLSVVEAVGSSSTSKQC